MERPEWTVEAAARELDLSQSTAYQYFRSLVDARLLAAYKTGRYRLGPAIIEFDRQTRRLDPLIRSAQPCMRALTGSVDFPGMALLCRIYGATVMCVDQIGELGPDFAVSYERGRPMPFYRGSASKVILAHLPPRRLRRHYDLEHAAIAAAGLGKDWKTFTAGLRKLRRLKVCVTRGELDVGLLGISAPLFGAEGEILGSIGLVLSAQDVAAREHLLEQLIARVRSAGDDVTSALRS
jgi:DNA-binding IclR family transcriptional regulator